MEGTDTAALDVVVFGAAGATGRALVDEAVAAGHRVAAAVRDPSRLVVPPEVEVVRADATDRASVRRAVDGRTAVLSAVGPRGRRAEGLYSSWARAVVEAMDSGRVVAVSSSGVRRRDPNHPLWYRLVARTLMAELYADMRDMEEILRRSTLDWTSVRPARITDTAPTGAPRVGDGVNPRGGRAISRGDLARFMVTALSDRTWSCACPTVAE